MYRHFSAAADAVAQIGGAGGSRLMIQRSDHVGEVLARVEGLQPRYQLRGEELFVRATVTSSLAPENPVFAGQFRQAWVQPVVPSTH